MIGIVWVVAWALYGGYLLSLLPAQNMSAPFLWALAITAGGLSASILAMRGSTLWKWLGLASSVALVILTDHIWSTYPGTWKEVLDWFWEHNPRPLFHLVVAPLFACLLG